MNGPDVERFIDELRTVLKKYFPHCEFDFLLRTPKSLKANIHLGNGFFIAVRFNARNGRTDFALIRNNRRIIGYDNLKQWHYHPYEDPSKHIPCEKPSIDRIISEMRKAVNV